jgi:hypothetical protein
MQRKPCPACSHPERKTIHRALGIGQAPRSIRRRYAGLNRRALARHRDECLQVGGGA